MTWINYILSFFLDLWAHFWALSLFDQICLSLLVLIGLHVGRLLWKALAALSNEQED
jgi:hypothetical protein